MAAPKVFFSLTHYYLFQYIGSISRRFLLALKTNDDRGSTHEVKVCGHSGVCSFLVNGCNRECLGYRGVGLAGIVGRRCERVFIHGRRLHRSDPYQFTEQGSGRTAIQYECFGLLGDHCPGLGWGCGIRQFDRRGQLGQGSYHLHQHLRPSGRRTQACNQRLRLLGDRNRGLEFAALLLRPLDRHALGQFGQDPYHLCKRFFSGLRTQGCDQRLRFLGDRNRGLGCGGVPLDRHDSGQLGQDPYQLSQAVLLRTTNSRLRPTLRVPG